MPQRLMEHIDDPVAALQKSVGNIDALEIFNNQILIAIYIRPEKTKGGIIYADSTREEDRHQSKVGLVLKKGSGAFVDEENKWFRGMSVDVGEWIIFRPSDGWPITVNNVLCRMLDDTFVRGKVEYPDQVW